MSNIQNWGITLSLTAVICGILEIIIPEGKISKTVYGVISLFAVLATVMPILNTFKHFKFSFKDFSFSKKLNENSDFPNQIKNQISDLASENIKAKIKSKLKELGVTSKKIEIFMDINDNTGIVIIKSKIYIGKEFKDLSLRISDEVSKTLNIETQVIEV